MDLGLNDRVAIITGSARGIGAETARMLAKEGASVVVTDLDLAAAEENARAIEAAGGKAIAVACDVRNEEQVKQLAGAALEAYGRIDVLVTTPAWSRTAPSSRWKKPTGTSCSTSP